MVVFVKIFQHFDCILGRGFAQLPHRATAKCSTLPWVLTLYTCVLSPQIMLLLLLITDFLSLSSSHMDPVSHT